MKIILLGAAGFIGTNLVLNLVKDKSNKITVVDRDKSYFKLFEKLNLPDLNMVEADLTENTDFETLVNNQDIVFHLISTSVPSTSNQHITDEIRGNVCLTSNLLEACARHSIKKVIFISSGGAVYGKESSCPLTESTPTNPITSYGVQKITIEKLLYLYHYMHGLDYRIIRLSNPYGPYQRPNGVLGVVSTFVYNSIIGKEINVYGDGGVVRDFIYIDDAIRGILNIVYGDSSYRTFNLGCGYGTSIKQLIETIKQTLNINLSVKYTSTRQVDVPVNYLNIERYEKEYGKLNPISLEQGIMNTAKFMKDFYSV